MTVLLHGICPECRSYLRLTPGGKITFHQAPGVVPAATCVGSLKEPRS